MPERPNTGRARRSLRTLGLAIGTLAALVAPTQSAAATPTPTKAEGYICLESVTVCRAAGEHAGGSAQRAEQYLRDYVAAKAARPPAAMTAASGFLTNPGPAGRRYFGWKLSRSVTVGEKVNIYRCQLVNGVPVNCIYIGDVGVQAKYLLRNRYVSDTETVVVNLMAESFGISHSAICLPTSSECIPQIGSRADLFAGSTSTSRYRDFQLRASGNFTMSFQWELDDPVTRTSALIGPYVSLPFQCRVYTDTNPGDCYFEGGIPGGGH
jgi:hypothetical protein